MAIFPSSVLPSKPNKPTKRETEAQSDMTYRTLTRSTSFANLDQYQYWHRVAPALAKMLNQGKYSIHKEYEYISLLANAIIPLLGPFQEGRDVYHCLLGGIGSIELSQNFQKSGSTVRLAFEPTGYVASTGVDPFNRITINDALIKLRALGVNVNMQLHQRLINDLTLTDAEEHMMTETQIRDTPFKTQALLALDLTETGIVAKEYFYPDVKAAVTGSSVRRIMYDAIKKAGLDRSLEKPLAMIESHMEQQPENDLYFMSCDLVNPEDARIKLYLADLNTTLARMQEHWTLGGRLDDEETMTGLQMIRELWMDSGIIEGKRDAPTRPTQPGDSSTHLPFILNYELHAGKEFPQPKFYFPLSGIADMKVAEVLTSFFEKHDMLDQAAVYTENLRSYYPVEDLDVIGDHQAWLSFSYTKKKGPYLTMYYH